MRVTGAPVCLRMSGCRCLVDCGPHVQANKWRGYTLDVLAVLDIRIIAIPIHFEFKDAMDLEDMMTRCPPARARYSLSALTHVPLFVVC